MRMDGRTDGHDKAIWRCQRTANVPERKTRHKHLITYLITRQTNCVHGNAVRISLTHFKWVSHIKFHENPSRER